MNCAKLHTNQGTVDISSRYIKLYTYSVDKTAQCAFYTEKNYKPLKINLLKLCKKNTWKHSTY